MKDFQLKYKKIFNEIVKNKNLFLFAFSLIPFIFKYFPFRIAILIVLILNEILYRLKNVKIKFESEQKIIRITFLSSLFFSFIFDKGIIGINLILNILVDRLTGILRNYFKLERSFKNGKNYSGIFFFSFLGFVLSILYLYYLQGYVLKSQIISIFLTIIIISFLESLNPLNFIDNLSIAIFTPFLFFILQGFDFRLHISGFNFVFSFFICAIFLIALLLLDIIKFEDTTLTGIILLILYNGLGYFLFLFHFLIFISWGILFKLEKQNLINNHFFNILELKPYFIFSIIISIILFFISPVKYMKTSLAFSILVVFLLYNKEVIIREIKNLKLNFIKNFRYREILFFEIILIIYLLIGVFLNLFKIIELPILLILLNLIIYGYEILSKRFNIEILKDEVKFLLIYIIFITIFILKALIKL